MRMVTVVYGFDNRRHVARVLVCVALLGVVGALTPGLSAQLAIPAQLPSIPTHLQNSSSSTTAQTPIVPAEQLSPEERGDLHMARKSYQAALQDYRDVPDKTAAVWNKIGIASQQMFIMDDARKSYQMSLKLDPKNPDVINNLGTIYYSLKEYAIAEHLYRKALKIRPKSALIYKNLGTDLLAEDKFKKGWECYQSALAIDPEVFERINQLRIGEPTPTQKRGAMSYYLAKSYVRAGMTDRAVEYLRMAIDQGFTDRKKVMADKEFASLHGMAAYEQLLAEQRMQ
jgi:tetratricopeptide (TPR) repeat protein